VINERIFETLDNEAIDSYRQLGYLCLRGQIPKDILGTIRERWGSMTCGYAAALGVETMRYLKVISQWRDLWKADPFFREVLEKYLAPIASASLELPGARLLHDHFIRKDANGSNGVIPWHQDSMFWPVDRSGLSTWLTLDTARLEQGCLQVIAGSHRWPTDTPVDFMQQERDMTEHKITWLPAEAGDLIILNSKTWHRSDPVGSSATRLAHIALWVPEQVRYAPELADWHPLNEQIRVAPGALLNEDEFPVFGARSLGFGNSQANVHAGVKRHKGMFNARGRVEATVTGQLGKDESLGRLLSDGKARSTLSKLLKARAELPLEKCQYLVDDVWISAAAYEQHRSRNVFNDAYARWEAHWGAD